ncbi:MAG TPA: hypothetical protein PKK06_08215 [Phycisphaerae bacterium]|nr:hypothetical protein [Phycisphaerae bacterium]HNU43707.1 hypothetical protein [Phycisphaerae bacterium]
MHRHPGSTGGSPGKWLGICFWMLGVGAACCLTLTPGCFDGGFLPGGGGGGAGGGGSTPDGNGAGDGDSSGESPDEPATVRVVLTVTNPHPLPGDQITLRCTVTDGTSAGVTFDFAPRTGRLVIDRTRGTASFIVDQSDVGVTFSFTCSGTNEAGTGPTSAPVLVIPVGLVEPVLEP